MRFEKSSDAKILESVLAEAVVGEIITYEKLSKAIGRDVRKFAVGALATARKAMLTEKRFVFGCESNKGLIRLNDCDIIKSTDSDRLRLHRTAKRSIEKLACSDFDKLDAASKRAHVTASAQMGAIAMFSHKSSYKRIESSVTEKTTQIAIGDTLKMFS